MENHYTKSTCTSKTGAKILVLRLQRAFYGGFLNELAVTFQSVHWVYALHKGHCLTQTHHVFSTINTFIHEKKYIVFKKTGEYTPSIFS